jgi:hypothetical protein
MIALTAVGVQHLPITFEMVLDRSGSMAAAAPGGTKMDALKKSVHILANLLIPGQGDQMGDVWFDSAFQVLTQLSPYDAAQQATLNTDVDTLTPRYATSIGGGLQLAQGQFPAGGTSRKVILVFTDGLENTAPMIASVQPQLQGDEVYAIGLGQPQNISSAALSSLATNSGGKYFGTDDTLVLRKNFVEVVADAFRQNMLADPIFNLSQGQRPRILVPITKCETRVTFVLNWEEPTSQISMEVLAPDGTMYSSASPASNQLVRYGAGPGYCYYEIAFPPVDPGSGDVIGPKRVGQWEMQITPVSLAGPSERCATNVLVESHLEFRTQLQARDIYHSLVVQAALLHDKAPGPNAKVTLTISAPTKSLAQVQTLAVLKRAADADRRPIPTGQRPLIPMKSTSYLLKMNREGSFAIQLPPPRIDGVYEFTLTAVGQACGGAFERYSSFWAYVGREADPRRTQVKIACVGPAAALLTVVPRDAEGILLGSGLATIVTAIPNGAPRLSAEDNLNGSYSIRLAWPEPRRPPVLKLTIGKTVINVPLGASMTKRSRRSRSGRS